MAEESDISNLFIGSRNAEDDGEKWPKLSVTLTGPRDLFACQSCGATEEDLTRWRECNEADEPTRVVVMLCEGCTRELVQKHPRLYIEMDAYEPLPGSMGCCFRGCKYRDGLTCLNPKQKILGGQGMLIRFPTPTVAFIDGTTPGGGKRIGSVEKWWHAPPECEDAPPKLKPDAENVS
jgi:hypothetical protein